MEQNLQSLYNWIDSHNISRQKKNLNRDFSDAVPMAEILKEHYPKLVDLHNYAPRSGRMRKIDNWNTLNRKVLKKLNIPLSNMEIENVADAVPGAIENVLQLVKEKVEEKEKMEKDCEDSGENENDSEVGKKAVRMVPAHLLDKQALELDIKNEAIEILTQKVTHLQTMLSIKDQRINELNAKLQELIAKNNNTGGFFNKIF